MEIFIEICRYVVVGFAFSVLVVRAVKAMETSHMSPVTDIDITITADPISLKETVLGVGWTCSTTVLMLGLAASMASMLVGTGLEAVFGAVGGVVCSKLLVYLAPLYPNASIVIQVLVGKGTVSLVTWGLYTRLIQCTGWFY